MTKFINLNTYQGWGYDPFSIIPKKSKITVVCDSEVNVEDFKNGQIEDENTVVFYKDGVLNVEGGGGGPDISSILYQFIPLAIGIVVISTLNGFGGELGKDIYRNLVAKFKSRKNPCAISILINDRSITVTIPPGFRENHAEILITLIQKMVDDEETKKYKRVQFILDIESKKLILVSMES